MECPKHTTKQLVNNNNTGVEYEYGVACALMTKEQYSIFLERVVNSHTYKDTIIDIGNSIQKKIEHLTSNLSCNKEDCYISLASTQDDSLGPSDVLVCCNDNIEFGISVKFSNTNNWNPSSRNFISEESISSLKKQYKKIYLPKYIEDMENKFGRCKTIEGTRNTWSRQRSKITDEFIDLIRTEVIDEWSTKNIEEREGIVGNGFQVSSPIDYYVINIKSDYSFKLSEPHKANYFSVDDITLEKYGTSYVAFKIHNKIIVKLQVKFNNGFIEKVKKTSVGGKSFKIGDIIFKIGDPFGSWNFNI